MTISRSFSKRLDLSALGAVAFLALLATPSFASVNACASTQPLNATVVGAGNGCTAVNDSFLNFTVFPAVGIGDAAFPIVTNQMAPAIGFTTAVGHAATTGIVDFLTTGQFNSANRDVCVQNSWCVPEGGANTNMSFSYTAQSTQIFGLELSFPGYLNYDSIDPGNTASITEIFCLGGVVSGCSSSASGYLQIIITSQLFSETSTYNICTPHAGGCKVTSSVNPPGIWFSPQTVIGIQDQIILTTPSGNGNAAWLIGSLDNDFFDAAPEPSTFALFAVALAVVALLRLRQRRQQA